eukprot:Gb_34885 [translate_table: standard]
MLVGDICQLVVAIAITVQNQVREQRIRGNQKLVIRRLKRCDGVVGFDGRVVFLHISSRGFALPEPMIWQGRIMREYKNKMNQTKPWRPPWGSHHRVALVEADDGSTPLQAMACQASPPNGPPYIALMSRLIVGSRSTCITLYATCSRSKCHLIKPRSFVCVLGGIFANGYISYPALMALGGFTTVGICVTFLAFALRPLCPPSRGGIGSGALWPARRERGSAGQWLARRKRGRGWKARGGRKRGGSGGKRAEGGSRAWE